MLGHVLSLRGKWVAPFANLYANMFTPQHTAQHGSTLLLQLGSHGMGRQLMVAGVVDQPADAQTVLVSCDPAIAQELLDRQVRRRLGL